MVNKSLGWKLSREAVIDCFVQSCGCFFWSSRSESGGSLFNMVWVGDITKSLMNRLHIFFIEKLQSSPFVMCGIGYYDRNSMRTM